MDCPKCRASNPDASRYCGSCATPLPRPRSAPDPPGPAAPAEPPSLTTTLDPLERGLRAGTLVAGGKYRILGEIGRGAMGIVYEADDLKLKRTVALKFLPAELTDDPEARERFVHEAQAASALDSPHICTVYDIGESEDRRMFIAMTLCSGESLRTRIRRGPLSPAEALSIAARIADGLAAAHARGVVHRDVKPANVLLGADGSVRVADFGLAKIAGEARLTRAGRAVGTVAYMSPEQLRGEDADARSDVWALGVVLYEMLTGALPFHGTTEHSLAYDIVNGEPKPLSALPAGTPAGCVRLLEKALSKDPDERFASAVEMADAIADIRESAGYSGHARVRRPSDRAFALDPASRRRLSLARALLVVLAAGAAIYAAFATGLARRTGAFLGLVAPPGADRHITIFVPSVPAGTPEDQVLASGLAEYLRRGLDAIARRTRSWVTPVENLGSYGVHEAADALRILGSNRVVSGTLKRAADSLTVTLEITDPARLVRLDSLTKTDDLANLATWQQDLLLESAARLGLAVTPADRQTLASHGTTVPRAFTSYLIGLGHLCALYGGPDAGSLERSEAALAAFEQAASLDPSFASAGIDLAETLRLRFAATGERSWGEKAEAQARAVLKSNEGRADGHSVLAEILHQLGRADEALAELERSRALDPLAYGTLIRLGTLLEGMNRAAEAEAAYLEAVRLRPDYWAGLSYLGYFYYVRGEYPKARAGFETVTRLYPDNAPAWNYLGAIQFKQGDYPRAIVSFERSNAVKKSAEAYSNLGVLYYYQGRYADSVTANENAIGLGATDYGYLVWGNLADAYSFTPGNEAKAAEAYRKAIALVEKELAASPGDARTRASLAVFLAKAGDAARAGTEIEAARRALPDDGAIALKAVVAYELCGERPRALAALRDFVRLKGPIGEVVSDPFLARLRQDGEYRTITGGKSGGPGAGSR